MKKMKLPLLFMTVMLSFHTVSAQLKTTLICPPIVVDVLDGKINELFPNSTQGEIKGKLPCFSEVQDEIAGSKCGGSIFYKDKDIYFYTGRDYVEIREKFKGKLTVPLMGASRTALFKWLGHPKIKDVNWDAFQMSYGTLVLYYKAGKVNKLQLSTKVSETLSLCE